jgi:putative transcriptional regulator
MELKVKTRIKELRARYNLTQLDLAKMVDVRRETIVFLEKGKYNPSLKLAYDISNVFKLNIEEVFIFKTGENKSIGNHQ